MLILVVCQLQVTCVLQYPCLRPVTSVPFSGTRLSCDGIYIYIYIWYILPYKAIVICIKRSTWFRLWRLWMQNIMASKNGFFTPSCIQFKQCEILCIFCCGKNLNLELYVEHLTYPVTFVPTTALSLSPISALAKCPFTWPQATDNHSSSHTHNTILIQGLGTIFIDQYRGYYCYGHTMDIHY